MRTRALATIAALAAGAFMAQAQVYSENIVGYVNVTVPAGGFQMVQNPLVGSSNTLNGIFETSPVNTTRVWYWNGGGWSLTTKRSTGFLPANANEFLPGEGFFVENTAGTDLTVTFVGDVVEGTNSITYPESFTPIGCVNPIGGAIETGLGFPAVVNDKIWTYNSDGAPAGWLVATRRSGGLWTGQHDIPGAAPGSGEPQIGVAQGFFIEAVAGGGGGTWTRSFDP